MHQASHPAHQMELEIHSSDRIRDVLQQVGAHYGLGLSNLHMDGVQNSNTRAATVIRDGSVICVAHQVTRERYEVTFNKQDSGVKYNVALKAAKQNNSAIGPGSSVMENLADGRGTEQNNLSMCIAS